MIVLFIFSALASAGLTAFVMMANGMSDSPSTPFQGTGMIIGAWLVTAVFMIAWLAS